MKNVKQSVYVEELNDLFLLLSSGVMCVFSLMLRSLSDVKIKFLIVSLAVRKHCPKFFILVGWKWVPLTITK